jgi:hypothetical protein
MRPTHTAFALALLSATGACLEPEPEPAADDSTGSMYDDGAIGVARVRIPDGVVEMTYVVDGGRAIVDGDIDLGSVEEVVGNRGGAVNAAELWLGGHVRFAFDKDFAPTACDGTTADPDCVCRDDAPCESARVVINRVMAELDERLPLDITEVTPDYPGNFILIMYEEDLDAAGRSAVGMKGGMQRLRFRSNDLTMAAAQPSVPTARHEMIHALGLWHEQSRTDRDFYVDVNLGCVGPGSAGEYAMSLDSKNTGPYDFNSIMHYGSRSMCLQPDEFPFIPDDDGDGCSCPTMEKIVGSGDPFDFGGTELSAEDVVTLHRMYLPHEGLNETRDRYGHAIAIGDFDADGYDDVAIGAPGDDRDATDTGSVYLYRGTYRGLMFWRTIAYPELGLPIVGSEAFGTALVAGRFNDDEFVDLAVGAPNRRVGTADAGEVYLFLGGIGGPKHRHTINETAPYAFTAENGDRFGAALAAGDLAGMGWDALIIGAPGDRSTVNVVTGAVYAYLADPTGEAIYPPSRVDNYMSAGSEMGAALATGDLDLDDNIDLAIGEPGFSNGLGMVLLMKGKTTTSPWTWGSMAMFTMMPAVFGVDAGGLFGSAVAIGNLSLGNSVKRELVIGIPGFNGARGRVQVREVTTTTYASTTIASLVGPGSTAGAAFGSALAIGDIDEVSTADDLVIGEPNHNGSRGRFHVMRGSTTTLTSITQAGINDNDQGDRFGGAFGIGHVNGWGLIAHSDLKNGPQALDLLVGASGEAADLPPPDLEDPAAGAVMTFWGTIGGQIVYDREWNQEYITGAL